MSAKLRNTWVVILAGGDGRRCSPPTAGDSAETVPSQFCSVNGGASLLQRALRRALAVSGKDRIVCVVNEAHRRWWEPQLQGLRQSVVVQPANRGSGLGVLLPLLVIAKTDPSGGILCLPSNHCVEHEDVLAESLRQATTAAVYDSAKITLLGLSAHAPDTGFGLLLPAAADSGVGMRPIRHFMGKVEDAEVAAWLSAGALQNSGIFAGSIERLMEMYPRSAPGTMLELKSIVERWGDTRQPTPELSSFYLRLPKIDFWKDVLRLRPERLQLLDIPPCGLTYGAKPERLTKARWSLHPPGTWGASLNGLPIHDRQPPVT